jgi:hypothetical protein
MKDWRLDALLNQVTYLLVVVTLPGLFVRLAIRTGNCVRVILIGSKIGLLISGY